MADVGDELLVEDRFAANAVAAAEPCETAPNVEYTFPFKILHTTNHSEMQMSTDSSLSWHGFDYNALPL